MVGDGDDDGVEEEEEEEEEMVDERERERERERGTEKMDRHNQVQSQVTRPCRVKDSDMMNDYMSTRRLTMRVGQRLSKRERHDF